MAYTKKEVRTPTAVGDIHFDLSDLDGTPQEMSGRMQITILDQNGAGMDHVHANLNVQASPAVKAAFINAIQLARAQAEAELI